MDRTNFSIPAGRSVWKFVVPPLLLAVGTGGDSTPEYWRLREAKLVLDRCVPTDTVATDEVPVASTVIASDLSHIQSVLKMTTTEVADCLGVSRQAIYDWRRGAKIKAANAAKLNNLRDAANVILTEQPDLSSGQPSSLLLHRRLPGGKNLFDVIASGGDGAGAARALLGIVKEENRQRYMLSEHRAQRVRAPRVPIYGVPALVDET